MINSRDSTYSPKVLENCPELLYQKAQTIIPRVFHFNFIISTRFQTPFWKVLLIYQRLDLRLRSTHLLLDSSKDIIAVRDFFFITNFWYRPLNLSLTSVCMHLTILVLIISYLIFHRPLNRWFQIVEPFNLKFIYAHKSSLRCITFH